MREAERIERLKRLRTPSRTELVLGIGDDCCIWRPKGSKEDLLLTTDFLLEDIHFRGHAQPRLLGRRALGRALSDVAAMGGEARFCLLSLAAPDDASTRWIQNFFKGVQELAVEYRLSLAGGDMTRAPRLICDVTACGVVPRGQALLRSGARPGDWIYVTGPLGGSASAGYPLHRIRPRLDLARWLRQKATACIDISDGLAADLARLCEASGVSAALDSVPVDHGATLEHALYGGEDYELLFTSPRRLHRSDIYRMGRIATRGRHLLTMNGRPLAKRGWDPFAPKR